MLAKVYAHLDRNDAHLIKALEDWSVWLASATSTLASQLWLFTEEEAQTMEQQKPPGRACPACASRDYSFRSGKRIEANAEESEPEQIETKYRCKSCGKEWHVRTPGGGAA